MESLQLITQITAQKDAILIKISGIGQRITDSTASSSTLKALWQNRKDAIEELKKLESLEAKVLEWGEMPEYKKEFEDLFYTHSFVAV